MSKIVIANSATSEQSIPEGRVSDEEDCCSCPETAYRHPAEGGFPVQERTKLVSSRPKNKSREFPWVVTGV